MAEMKISIDAALKKLLASPNVASRKPIFEKYDKNVQGNTAAERGAVAASVSACFQDFPELSGEDKNISVAIATGGNPLQAKISAEYAAKAGISECLVKLACVGAEPLCATDCLNFGNPEKPDQMADLVAGIEGVKQACETLKVPIVSGNVSLYNESHGKSIPPSALVSMFGRVNDPTQVATLSFQKPGQSIFLIGGWDMALGGSEFLSLFDRQDSTLPQVDLLGLNGWTGQLRMLVQEGVVTTAYPVGSGGRIASLLQALFLSGLGAQITLPEYLESSQIPHALFGESLGVIVGTDQPEKVSEMFGDQASLLGQTQTDFAIDMTHNGDEVLASDLSEYKKLWEDRLRGVF